MFGSVDLSKCGNVVGVMQFDNVVHLWCQSLDGGSTDSRIVPVTFPSEGNALLFCGWFDRWLSNADYMGRGAMTSAPLSLVLDKAGLRGFGGAL